MSVRPRIVAEAAVIAVLGVMLGLFVNHELVLDAFAGRLSAPAASAPQEGARLPQPVLLAEVRELVAGGALPVDAREVSLYLHGHIPGAVSLPLGEADAQLGRFRRHAEADRTLVVYCSGYGCADSFDLGQYLLAQGYQDVRVFEGGYPEWRDAGLPVEKGEK